MPGDGWSLAGLPVSGIAGLIGGQATADGLGLAAVRILGGFGFLEDLNGQLVVFPGALQAGLAGRAGLVGAVGAVALVPGGLVHGGQDRADAPVGEGDGTRSRRGGRDPAQAGADRVVLSAYPDPGQVADQADGTAGLLVIGGPSSDGGL